MRAFFFFVFFDMSIEVTGTRAEVREVQSHWSLETGPTV